MAKLKCFISYSTLIKHYQITEVQKIKTSNNMSIMFCLKIASTSSTFLDQHSLKPDTCKDIK